MKKIIVLVSVVIILGLAACSRQAQASDVDFKPPIDGVEWGMVPEEVMEVLSLSEDCIQSSDEWTTILQCSDREVFGQDADVLMVFDMKSQIGLLKVSICFSDASEESLTGILADIYGEHSAVDAEGVPCRWESEKIEELPENIQERFRYMWVDAPLHEGQSVFSTETVWNSYKSQPLVTVALNGDVLTYDGGNMAAYLIYHDDTAYEQLQQLRQSTERLR